MLLKSCNVNSLQYNLVSKFKCKFHEFASFSHNYDSYFYFFTAETFYLTVPLILCFNSEVEMGFPLFCLLIFVDVVLSKPQNFFCFFLCRLDLEQSTQLCYIKRSAFIFSPPKTQEKRNHM